MNGFWWLCLKLYDKQNQGQQQHFQPTSTIFHCTDAISHYFTSPYLPLGGTQHVEVGANHKSHESGHALHPLHPARLEILEIFISNWQCKVLYFLPEWKNLHNFSFKAFVCFCRYTLCGQTFLQRVSSQESSSIRHLHHAIFHLN